MERQQGQVDRAVGIVCACEYEVIASRWLARRQLPRALRVTGDRVHGFRDGGSEVAPLDEEKQSCFRVAPHEIAQELINRTADAR